MRVFFLSCYLLFIPNVLIGQLDSLEARFDSLVQIGEIGNAANEVELLIEYALTSDELIRTKLIVHIAEFYRKNRRFTEAGAVINRISPNQNLPAEILSNYYLRKAAIYQEGIFQTDSIPLLIQTAIQYAKNGNNELLIADCYNEYGFYLENIGLFANAIQLYTKSRSMASRLQDTALMVHYSINLMRTEFKLKNYSECIKVSKEAIGLIKDKEKNSNSLTYLYEYLSTSQFKLGQYDIAYQNRNNYFKWYEYSFRKDITEQFAKLESTQKVKEAETIKEKLVQENLYKQSINRFYIYLIVILTIGLVVFAFLIYSLVKKNKRFKKLSEEKSFLFQEVQHRVKNNLQNLLSLLSIQQRYLTSEDCQVLNKSTIRRVEAIHLTHELLYVNENFDHCDAKQYIESLIQKLRYQTDENFVQIEADLDSIIVPFRVLLPVGFILSELVANTLKHNPIDKDLTISIVLKEIPGHLKFIYYDSGETFEKQEIKKQSFGSKLIQIYSKQLKAIIRTTESFHYKFLIPFDNENSNS